MTCTDELTYGGTQSICNECEDGWKISKASERVCVIRIADCFIYEDDVTCKLCDDGYEVNENGGCDEVVVPRKKYIYFKI